MSVQGTSSSTAAASLASATSSLGGNTTLSKETFLQLLITQMKNQDPLSPMDNQAFLAQLAQFSSLEQMQNLNDKVDSAMNLSQSIGNTAAVSLIGREVRATGDTITLGSSGNAEIGYFLSSDAQTVTVTVKDSSGNAVRTMVGAEGAAGAHQFEWNGLDDDGVRLKAGSYTFDVSAVDGEGASVTASTLVLGQVTGVTYKNGIAYLMIDGREVPLSEVLEVHSGSN